MVGRRCGNGIVFTWGISNDGRLGVDLRTFKDIEEVDEQSRELIAVKPSVVKFAAT